MLLEILIVALGRKLVLLMVVLFQELRRCLQLVVLSGRFRLLKECRDNLQILGHISLTLRLRHCDLPLGGLG